MVRLLTQFNCAFRSCQPAALPRQMSGRLGTLCAARRCNRVVQRALEPAYARRRPSPDHADCGPRSLRRCDARTFGPDRPPGSFAGARHGRCAAGGAAGERRRSFTAFAASFSAISTHHQDRRARRYDAALATEEAHADAKEAASRPPLGICLDAGGNQLVAAPCTVFSNSSRVFLPTRAAASS